MVRLRENVADPMGVVLAMSMASCTPVVMGSNRRRVRAAQRIHPFGPATEIAEATGRRPPVPASSQSLQGRKWRSFDCRRRHGPGSAISVNPTYAMHDQIDSQECADHPTAGRWMSRQNWKADLHDPAQMAAIASTAILTIVARAPSARTKAPARTRAMPMAALIPREERGCSAVDRRIITRSLQ